MKTTYDYVMVKLPLQARDSVQAVYDKRKGTDKECRKADIWVEMSKKVTK